MIKHTQTIRRVFDHFVRLALKGLRFKVIPIKTTKIVRPLEKCIWRLRTFWARQDHWCIRVYICIDHDIKKRYWDDWGTNTCIEEVSHSCSSRVQQVHIFAKFSRTWFRNSLIFGLIGKYFKTDRKHLHQVGSYEWMYTIFLWSQMKYGKYVLKRESQIFSFEKSWYFQISSTPIPTIRSWLAVEVDIQLY